MSGARKYAFVQSQALFWVLYGVAAYLTFTKVGVVYGLIVTVPMLLVVVWMLIRMRRRYKRQFPHGRKR